MIEVPNNDIEYYERKVVRMEQDISLLQEELNRVRLRLRTAEDYEIKYRILIKNNEVDLQRAKIEAAKAEEEKNREQLAVALRESDERWMKARETLENDLRKEAEQRLAGLTQQLEAAQRKIKQLSQKKEEMDLFSFKIRKFEKENASLQAQLLSIKTASEKQRSEQLSSLRNQLNSTFREKLANERQGYQNKINSLSKQLAETQVQQEKFELILPQLSNAELLAVRDLFTNAQSSYEKQIAGFEEIIIRKNSQIKASLRQQSEREEKIQEVLNEKNKIIAGLEEEVTRLRKENQEEILVVTQKLKDFHNVELEALKEQVKNMTEFCKGKEAEMSKELANHRQQLQSQTERHQREEAQLIEERIKSQNEAGQLASRLKEKQERIAELSGQSQQRQSQAGSNAQAGQYENGLQFLQKQLRKTQQRLQQKTRLCSKLEGDVANLLKEMSAQHDRLHQLIKAERKESEEKISNLQAQIQGLVDQLLAKAKEVTQCKKSFLAEKLQLEVQARSLQSELQELEGDNDRLRQTKKQIEETLLSERKGKHTAPSRQGQSHEHHLEAIFRQKYQRLLGLQEEGRQRAGDELKVLKDKVNQLNTENAALKRAHQRLLNESDSKRQSGKDEKEKKIATIELQLVLLQNIYQQLVERGHH